jgi:hypothetical protein
MRCCNRCKRPVAITEASRFRTHVYATDLGPFMYLGLWECRCQNTLSVVLWQDEECSLAEAEEIAAEGAAAELHKLEEAPLDRATYRPFFSLTHELADRGL